MAEIDIVLKCRTCKKERRTKGNKGNPPKLYCCGQEMKEKKGVLV